MATFIEPKFPLTEQQRNQRKAAANQTLEDVAEELLNGILCQYEPPNRTNTTKSRKPSGILRQPKDKRAKNMSHRQQTNSSRVRWIDEQKEETLKVRIMNHDIDAMGSPNPGGGCNIAEACIEAGIEVGCVSTSETRNSRDPTTDMKTIRMMNAKEAIATVHAKSPRNSQGYIDNIVFDDDGNLTYGDKAKKMKGKGKPGIALPEAPPPPNKKERFFPELCGVRINCGDDEAYVQVAPKYNLENSINNVLDRCGNNIADDDDELIMMMDELENSLLEDNDESDSILSEVETLQKHINQVRLSSKKQNDSSKRLSNTVGREESKKKPLREVVDHYAVKEDSDDDDADADEDDNDTVSDENKTSTNSSAKFLRRVWSRNGAKKDNTNTSLDNVEDEIKPCESNTRRSISRSRSPSRRHREGAISSKPRIVHDVYESVEVVKEEKKAAPKIGLGAVLKSIASKSPRGLKKNSSLSSASLADASTEDWDESVPIIHGMDSALANNVTKILPSSTAAATDLSASALHRSDPAGVDLSQSLNANNTSIPKNTNMPQPPRHPYSNTYLPATQQTQHQPIGSNQLFPHIHPAHPLANGLGRVADLDDKMERQSFITAYRHGIDPVNNTSVNRQRVNDDIMERQSFIGAYRDGIEQNSAQNRNIPATQIPAPYPPPLPMPRDDFQKLSDDKLERQSFIGVYRQGIDDKESIKHVPGLTSIPEGTITNGTQMNYIGPAQMPLQYSGSTPVTRDDFMERQSFITAYRQNLDPVQRPAPGSMSHHDIMERMSYITANRNGVADPPTTSSTMKRLSPPKQSRSNKKSGRTHDVESHQPMQNMVPLPNGPLFDSMGNMVYLNPSSIYNPMMIPMYQDPQTRHNVAPVPNVQNTYPIVDPNIPYYQPSYYNPPNYVDGNNQASYYNPQSYSNGIIQNDNVSGTVHENHGDFTSIQQNTMTDEKQLNQEETKPTLDTNNSSSTKSEHDSEPELSWEERTRLAWERIRGGLSALTFETPVQEEVADKDVDTTAVETLNESRTELNQSPNQTESFVNNSNQPMIQMNPQYNLQQPHDLIKRVSFGEPQQFIYYDEQDENRSTMSLPVRSSKKKKKFRGTKLVGGVIGKVKSSLNKVASLTKSTSSDTHDSLPSGRSSHSTEWDGNAIGMYPNTSMGTHQQSLPRGQSYIYPMKYGNQVMIPNSNQSYVIPPGRQYINNTNQQQPSSTIHHTQTHPATNQIVSPHNHQYQQQQQSYNTTDNVMFGYQHPTIPFQDRSNGRRSL